MSMSTQADTVRTSRARWRRLAAVAAVCIAAGASTPVSAQQVLVMVNGEPITSYDVDQRSRFVQISTHKTPARQQIIDELINEKLKVQVLKRYKLEITDKEVEDAFANMGRNMRMTPQQLTQALAQANVDANTLKSRIRSDLAWQQIVRGRFQQSLQVRDKDVLDALASRKADEKEQDAAGFEYMVRPILFMVTNKTATDIETRKREAEALRARFNNCDEGLPFARALRNVVVRDQVKRTSADLPPALRKIRDDTPVGRLTNPEVTQQGIEVFALCSRKETTIETAAKRQIRETLFAEKFQEQSKRYIQELRRGAMIEVK
jgi:peptidyl-prolyl cis-trans isomerase SurA